jgi:hypothetical protein
LSGGGSRSVAEANLRNDIRCSSLNAARAFQNHVITGSVDVYLGKF